MKRLVFAGISMILSVAAMAQGGGTAPAAPGNPPSQQLLEDFIFDKQAVKERGVIQWPYLREADVAYQKRVHRIIDTREKQNRVMGWPKSNYSIMLYNAVINGEVQVFKDNMDSFLLTIITPEQIGEAANPPVTIQKPRLPEDHPDYDPFDVVDTTIINPFEADKKIVKYEVIEDWIFDRKTSEMYVRIIAFAPLIDRSIGGMTIPNQPLFWVKYVEESPDPNSPYTYQDLRTFNVNLEIFNRSNDAARLTYDDYFEQRQFSSFVIKESNPYDMKIKDMDEFRDKPKDIFVEGERIKNDLMIMEHDLWEY